MCRKNLDTKILVLVSFEKLRNDGEFKLYKLKVYKVYKDLVFFSLVEGVTWQGDFIWCILMGGRLNVLD